MMLSRRVESWKHSSINQQGASTDEKEINRRTEETKETRHDAEAEIDQKRRP